MAELFHVGLTVKDLQARSSSIATRREWKQAKS